MNYLTNEDKRRLCAYFNESGDRLRLSEDDFNLILNQKKNEPHYCAMPIDQKPVKIVFEGDESIIDDHVIQDWTLHIDDIILNRIGIYDSNDNLSNECICESLL